MVYLDANAFYWYLGRENLPMQSSVPKCNVAYLRSFLDAQKDKCVPASVLMEMVVHFREHPNAIKRIISFCEDKGLKVLNNIHEYHFTCAQLTMLRLTNDDDIIKQYACKLLDKKIEIEVNHAYTFLEVVSLLYADYYLKSCSSLDQATKDNIIFFLGMDMLNGLRNDYCEQLTSTLRDGYAINKDQQYLKKIYIELLVQNCVIIHMIIDAVVKYLEDEQDLYEVMRKSAADARNNGFDDSGIMQIIRDALATDSKFLKSAETEIPAIFLRKGYSKHQSNYIKVMLEAWLERGQKLRKNDIFDMLCVGVLDKKEKNSELNILIDKSPYLISFDDTMMKFICENSGNKRLIKQFLIL